ncbi:MAG: hypothetical protein WD872_18770 [Pirellulaceae bacterium]
MVRTIAILLAVLGTLVVADRAEARGRRGGCSGGNCYAASYSGCPGGNCAVPVGPSKYAVQTAPPAVVANRGPAPVVAAAPAARNVNRYTASNNRRWLGRRR